MNETRPNWRSARDKLIKSYKPESSQEAGLSGSKHMDRYALIPFNQVPSKEMETLGAEWQAYELMLLEKKKRYIQETIVRDFGEYLRKKSTEGKREAMAFADFGCGNGGMTKFLVGEANKQGISSKFFLIDRSAAALYHGWLRFQRDGFVPVDSTNNDSFSPQIKEEPNLKLHFLQRDIAVSGIDDNSLDAVININVLHHLTFEESTRAVNEIFRVLKPGGLFIIEDTAKLPNNLFGRLILPKIISKAVSISTMKNLAAESGFEVTGDFLEGARLFIHDAQRAFVQAMSLGQFEELLRESDLGRSLTTVRSLTSPKFPFKLIFPKMNYAFGFKT